MDLYRNFKHKTDSNGCIIEKGDVIIFDGKHQGLYDGFGYIYHCVKVTNNRCFCEDENFHVNSVTRMPNIIVKKERLEFVIRGRTFTAGRIIGEREKIDLMIEAAKRQQARGEFECGFLCCCVIFVTRVKEYAEKDRDSKGRVISNGDLIEFKRPVYSHWGVYVNGYIIDVSGNGALSGSIPSSPISSEVVKASPLDEIAKGGNLFKNDEFFVNNALDHKRRAYDVDRIVDRTLKQVGKHWDYNVLSNNCEHFATLMRYGESTSLQVRNVVWGGVKGVVIGATMGDPIGATVGAVAGVLSGLPK